MDINRLRELSGQRSVKEEDDDNSFSITVPFTYDASENAQIWIEEEGLSPEAIKSVMQSDELQEYINNILQDENISYQIAEFIQEQIEDNY